MLLTSNTLSQTSRRTRVLRSSNQRFYNQGFLEAVLLTSRGPTTRVSYNQRFSHTGVFRHGFLHPRVLHPGVLTSRYLTFRGDIRESYDQAFLRPRVLTTRGFYSRGFLHLIVVKTRGSNSQGFYNQGPYNQQHRQESLHLQRTDWSHS